MGLRPLELNGNEIQRLITQAFHETGYQLEPKDPILAQYVIQKTLLHDFNESQMSIFNEFSDRIIPALKDETKKLETQRDRLWDLARSAAEEVVCRAGGEYTSKISNTMRQADNTLLENLDRHITRLRDQQNGILAKLEERHEAFVDTAVQFEKCITTAFIGGAVLFACLLFFIVYFFKQ